MNNFIGWKFGVPVNVKNVGFPNPFFKDVLLIYEEELFFKVLAGLGTDTYSKKEYTYELIPYQYGSTGPRYPVCETSKVTAYCNRDNSMAELYVTSTHLEKLVPATLNIDGKTIKLSAEIVAELKKKLGII